MVGAGGRVDDGSVDVSVDEGVGLQVAGVGLCEVGFFEGDIIDVVGAPDLYGV